MATRETICLRAGSLVARTARANRTGARASGHELELAPRRGPAQRGTHARAFLRAKVALLRGTRSLSGASITRPRLPSGGAWVSKVRSSAPSRTPRRSGRDGLSNTRVIDPQRRGARRGRRPRGGLASRRLLLPAPRCDHMPPRHRFVLVSAPPRRHLMHQIPPRLGLAADSTAVQAQA